MTVRHLPPDSTGADVAAVLDEEGCVVVTELASPALMDAVRSELEPFLAATPDGPDAFSGHHTRRTGGLVARSPAARQLVMHPIVLDAARAHLAGATHIQLHLTQLIAIGPDQPAQPVHRDQWAFDFFPFPVGYAVQCNTLWAMTDFTAANGATRVIPGSHRFEDKQRFEEADTEPAEMRRGSVLFYTGALYHGGGANHSNDVRIGVNITYARAWLRQEENQYLSVPPDVARTLDDDLLRLMGYGRGAYALGYVDDLRDPLAVLRGDGDGAGVGFHARGEG
ncbi:MAG TPA: phytanoyl-CoA dioxygenase family protein [Acidimicrobiales bacterium]|nr:phytanoyl-CoA dioxygenase family protein [Acidimicrobiales bacterium]